MTQVIVIVQGILLAVVVAMAWASPSPITVGCVVVVGALFLLAFANHWRQA